MQARHISRHAFDLSNNVSQIFQDPVILCAREELLMP